MIPHSMTVTNESLQAFLMTESSGLPYPPQPGPILQATQQVAGVVQDGVKAVEYGVNFFQQNLPRGVYILQAPIASFTPFKTASMQERETVRLFRITCRASVAIVPDREFVFRVRALCDCRNILQVIIEKVPEQSSTAVSTTFVLNFKPEAGQQDLARGSSRMRMSIQGEWDPLGPKREEFTGALWVQSDGSMTLEITSPQGLVWARDAHFPSNMSCQLPQPATDPSLPPEGTVPPVPAPLELPPLIDLYFTTGSAALGAGQVQRLSRWIHALPKSLLAAVKMGHVPFLVTGHASPTGNPQGNERLSTQRAIAATNVLASILGPSIAVRWQGVGSAQKLGNGNNDAMDRRARIWINNTMIAPVQ